MRAVGSCVSCVLLLCFLLVVVACICIKQQGSKEAESGACWFGWSPIHKQAVERR